MVQGRKRTRYYLRMALYRFKANVRCDIAGRGIMELIFQRIPQLELAQVIVRWIPIPGPTPLKCVTPTATVQKEKKI